MADVTLPSVKSPGSLRQLAIYLTRDKLALCAALFLVLLLACVLLGPLLVGELAGKLGLRQRNMAPFSFDNGFIYVLGADTLGRPILARLIVGAQNTLGIAAAVGGLDDPAWTASILESGMPPMVTAGVLAARADLDENLATTVVGIGLLLALVSIPLLALAVG